MFGYVRPFTPELKVRELEDYKAVYCGLCRTMGKRHGFLARFALNYDFAFLAMLLSAGDASCRTTQCRCPAHPFRRRKMCIQMTALDVAADESMILSYHKLQDDVADHGFLRGLPARIASFALRRAYRKAAAAQPEFDRNVVACLKELHMLEQEKSSSLDRPADTFARILKAAAPVTGEEGRDRALEQLLYHVGRWIYLIDAWDDRNQDGQTGAYNPVLERFAHRPEEHVQDMRVTLLHSRNLAISAYGLIQSHQWDGILSNILYLGLNAVENAVFAGQWRKKQKNVGD